MFSFKRNKAGVSIQSYSTIMQRRREAGILKHSTILRL